MNDATDPVVIPAGYLLDTNAISGLVKDDSAVVDELRSVRLVATHVQANELSEAPDRKCVKAKLLGILEQLGPERTPTRSAVWDVSEWDQACWPEGDGMYAGMLARLQTLDAMSRKRSRKRSPKPANQPRDILTAETAVKNGFTLVTDDKNLAKVTVEFGGKVITLAELRETARRAGKKSK
jgi:predicted nucleic acid-binding protein